MATSIEGTVVWRGDEDYEATRRSMLWNELKPARFPEVIVRATSEMDVVAAVELARSRGLQVAVRAGGHSWVGSPLREGSLLIDLASLRALSIDKAARTASLQPAVTGSELAAALAESGLAFPVGHCGSVGMSGFLLSGGLGWNSGVWGPACLSLQAIDVVTPSGELVHADADQNAELLWAARGAGPGFVGVVTRFQIGLQSLPRAITTSTYVYGLSDLEEVACWAAETAESLPRMVELTLLLASAPPGVPATADGKVVIVTATAFVDTPQEAADALAPLERCPALGRSLARQVKQPTPFETLFRDLGGLWPERHRYAADTLWATADFADTLLPLREQILAAPSPKSLALAVMPPPPPAATKLPDMAFSMAGRIFVACYVVWENEVDDEANLAWLPATMTKLEPLAIGHYVAETDLLAAPARAQRSFAEPNWKRLQALRRNLDPDGLFASYLTPDDRLIPVA